MKSYQLPKALVNNFITLEVHPNALIVTSGEFFITVTRKKVAWQLYESREGTSLLDIEEFYIGDEKDYKWDDTMCKTYYRTNGPLDGLFRMPKNEFGFTAIRIYRAGVSEDAMGRLFALDGITFLHKNKLAIQIEQTHSGFQADIIRISRII